MIIANASGCSSVWGGTAATSPWVVDEKNRGTAWGRSLFEDNAEYGFGMLKAHELRRKKLILDINRAMKEVPEMSVEIKACLQKWIDNYNNVEVCDEVYEQMDTYFD
jgi:pyruvate/2-oxoacid:ferredoxin oxidoreductase beta subunit